MKEYTDIESVENYLLLDVSEEFEDQITEWIKSASAYVKQKTNRDWIADENATARSFNGNGKCYLNIPECIEIDEVEIGENFGVGLVETEDYVVDPDYQLPIRKIVLKDGYFDRGIQNVKITAKWGYAEEVPEDIKWATTVLVAGIVLAQQNQNGEIGSEKIGNYSVTYKDDQHKNDVKQAEGILRTRTLILI